MRLRVLMGVGLAWLVGAGPAFAEGAIPRGTGCTKTADVATSASQDVGRSAQTTEITANPARVCSVSFTASGANGYAEVFDSPDASDADHGQSRRIAEPGSATAGESKSEFFGDAGKAVFNGLGVRVVRGRVMVSYQD